MLGIIVVDVQNDFSETGALPVPNASSIIPVINKIIVEVAGHNRIVLYSRDWHPIDHVSFTSQGGQWPAHCVQGSAGAELISSLELPQGAIEIKKGMSRETEAYSAFSGFVQTGEDKPLDDYLKEQNVDCVYVMGLATDFCVKETVLDAKRLGYRVVFVENASAGVAVDTTEDALAEMAAAHVMAMKAY